MSGRQPVFTVVGFCQATRRGVIRGEAGEGSTVPIMKHLGCHSKDFGLYGECLGEPRNDFKKKVFPRVTHLFNNAPLLKTL